MLRLMFRVRQARGDYLLSQNPQRAGAICSDTDQSQVVDADVLARREDLSESASARVAEHEPQARPIGARRACGDVACSEFAVAIDARENRHQRLQSSPARWVQHVRS